MLEVLGAEWVRVAAFKGAPTVPAEVAAFKEAPTVLAEVVAWVPVGHMPVEQEALLVAEVVAVMPEAWVVAVMPEAWEVAVMPEG